MTESYNSYDLVILGGGLAGLSLAIQIHQQKSGLKIVVLEKRDGEAPEAAHKVGESSVEIGAHYLSKVIGIENHIKENQLPKLGLRFFFKQDKNEAIETRMEVGEHRFFKTPSFQLDRGILENHLISVCEERGIQVRLGAKVKGIDLPTSDTTGTVTWEDTNRNPHSFQSTWIVDATGRSSLVKKKLGFREDVKHDVNSVWFRVKGRVNIDTWSDDPRWSSRVDKEPRWLSTNHLMGEGYWVWIIPLSSGNTSIGIVAEQDLHPMTMYNNIDKAKMWLAEHEPQCARMITGYEIMDFIGLRKFSYSCKQVFSGQRWALVGEAGRFLDPFYSPGSDYIGISNTFVSDLIIRERSGENFAAQAQIYEKVYSQFFDIHMDLYYKQYPMFGDGIPMVVKIVWDFSYYWCVPAFLYFQELLTDLKIYVQHQKLLEQIGGLNKRVQKSLREAASATKEDAPSIYFEFHKVPFMYDLNAQLSKNMDDDQKRKALLDNFGFLQEIGEEMERFALAWKEDPSLETITKHEWKILKPVLGQVVESC
jgi:flavin-dependent dehydrogenase